MNPFDCAQFVIHHPLRYLCPESPVDFLLKHAVFLSDRSMECLSSSYEIPVSPEKLDDILKSRNIAVEPQIGSSSLNHPSWHMLAWTDPEKDSIHIHEKNLETLAESGTGVPEFQDLTLEKIRCIIISHELFHILCEEIEKPLSWNSLKEAERIIIEEIAARIFSARLNGQSSDPFILDELIRCTFGAHLF